MKFDKPLFRNPQLQFSSHFSNEVSRRVRMTIYFVHAAVAVVNDVLHPPLQVVVQAADFVLTSVVGQQPSAQG